MKAINFKTVDELLEALERTGGLYNPENHYYVWQYNEWTDDSNQWTVAYMEVDVSEATRLQNETQKRGEGYWGAVTNDGYCIDGIEAITEFFANILDGWYDGKDMDLLWLDVYADTISEDEDDANIASLLVFRCDAFNWFLDNVKPYFASDEQLADSELFEDWLNEYTCDETIEFFADFTNLGNAILQCER